jgi:hypothetical protein
MSVAVNTLVLALRQVFVMKTLTAWIALPALWAVYNAVPSILFYTSLMGSTRTLQIMAFWMQAANILAGAGAVVALFFIR